MWRFYVYKSDNELYVFTDEASAQIIEVRQKMQIEGVSYMLFGFNQVTHQWGIRSATNSPMIKSILERQPKLFVCTIQEFINLYGWRTPEENLAAQQEGF